MTKQPYHFRASDWIPIKGPIEYEKRVSHAYNAYNYKDMKKESPQAVTRRNILAVYDISTFIGIALAGIGIGALAIRGIDKLVDLIK